MREVKIADKSHPDYKKYEEKAEEYKKQYYKKLEDISSLNLSPKEKDRKFCQSHRKFMEKMKILGREYKQIYTKSIPYEELRKELEENHNKLMALRKQSQNAFKRSAQAFNKLFFWEGKFKKSTGVDFDESGIDRKI